MRVAAHAKAVTGMRLAAYAQGVTADEGGWTRLVPRMQGSCMAPLLLRTQASCVARLLQRLRRTNHKLWRCSCCDAFCLIFQ